MRSRLLALATCAVLSACVGQTVSPDGPAGAVTPAENRAMTVPQRQPDPVATPTPVPPRPAIDPASLVGMTGERITALFGAPVFVRRDPPGEFWRYRDKTCVLELFFYPRSGSQHVDHIETRNADLNNQQDRAECVAKLRKPAVRG